MKKSIRNIVVALFLAHSSFALGQSVITGHVTDTKTGEPLIGATVTVVGENALGTVTDIDGNFSLRTNLETPWTIDIDYIGYRKQQLEVYDPEDPVEVSLNEKKDLLGEVVVVGYGTQRRTQLTGSVTQVNQSAIKSSPSATVDEALSGIVAGLNITASSGQPGAAAQLRIRGGNSVNASNEPLYVIDGFIYYKDASAAKTGIGAIESSLNPLATVNPGDIQSIEVLKDVSATAIYGSRGANGVILITTKKGSAGRSDVNYRFSAGVDAILNKLDLMNATQWASFQKTYFNNKGGYTDEEIAALGKGTDWQDAMLRTAFRQSHELSASGGNEHGHYAVSANYTDQDGIIVNSGFKRYNFHINADWTLRPGLTAGIQTTYGKSTQNGMTTTEEVTYNSSPYSAGITNSFVYGLLMPPVVSVYDEDGGYNFSNPYEYAYFAIGSKKANALADLEESVAESINSYLLSNIWAQYNWKELTAKVSIGLNKEQITQNYFSPSYTSLGLATEGLGGIGNKRNEIWQQEYTLLWTHKINLANYFDILVGYTQQNSKTNYDYILTSHFTNESLKHNNLADGSEVYAPESGQSEATLKSWLGRINYTLLDKYNATVTLRADKSSRFSDGNEWGIFPSVGLSWNVDREAFLRHVKTINSLKLRASFGVVGNQEIGDYEYSESYTAGQYNGSSSYSKSNATNDDLKWETTASYNVGFDATLLNERLSVVFDVYYKKTSDLLLDVPTGFSTGVSSQLQNVGNVENKGLELAVNGVIIEGDEIEWTASANIAFNKNEITDMGSTNNVIMGSKNEFILRKGEALGTFYGLDFDGIVQLDEDVSSLPTMNGSTPSPGDVKYRDANGDGKINGNDRVVLGSYQPDFTYGFSSQLKIKRFDFSFSFAGSHGNELFNGLGLRLETTGDSYNVLAKLTNSWTTTNPSNRYPYAGNDRTTSYIDSRYVEDASYLKLRNMTLGYTLPIPPRILSRVRVFATGSNLFAITDYSGYDPEVASGSDYGAYPSARTIIGGIEISL